LTALQMRNQRPAEVVEHFDTCIAPLDRGSSPAPDTETMLEHFESEAFAKLDD
jgi:hypothetical protein